MKIRWTEKAPVWADVVAVILVAALAVIMCGAEAPIPKPPAGCPTAGWVVAYQYQPVTGQLHHRTDRYSWEQWLSGVVTDSLGSSIQVKTKEDLYPAIIWVHVYYAAVDGAKDYALLYKGKCLWSSPPVPNQDTGYPFHVDFAVLGEPSITIPRS